MGASGVCRWCRAVVAAFSMAVAATSFANGAVDVTIDSSTMTNGYMNVFELPSNGGAYVFSSGWGIGDLNATFPNSNTVNFTPNTIGDPNSFWYTPSGQPGATGNKIMEANLYAQNDGGLAGQTINFSGNVTSFTLQTGTNPNTDYTFKAFIRDFAADFSTVVEQVATITSTGLFNLSLATINDPARHVQWGLQMKGPDVWFTDVATKGSVTVTAVPEPASVALLGIGGGILALVARRRMGRRK